MSAYPMLTLRRERREAFSTALRSFGCSASPIGFFGLQRGPCRAVERRRNLMSKLTRHDLKTKRAQLMACSIMYAYGSLLADTL